MDGLLITSRDDGAIEKVVRAMSERFSVKDLGVAWEFTAVKIIDNPHVEALALYQVSATECAFRNFNMADSEPVGAPIEQKFVGLLREQADPACKKNHCRSAGGSILYSSTFMQPEITFPVDVFAQSCEMPIVIHWTTVTRDFPLSAKNNETASPVQATREEVRVHLVLGF